MRGKSPVSWAEALRLLVGCSFLLGLVYAVLRVLGEQVPIAAPVVMFLGQWFWDRHRHWGAGAVAVIAGSAAMFAFVDHVRPHMDRLLADALGSEVGLLVALAVFTCCSRLRTA